MDYREQMEELVAQLADVQSAAHAAFCAADNEDGAPVHEIKALYKQIKLIFDDAESVLDHGITTTEMRILRGRYAAEQYVVNKGVFDEEGFVMRLREMGVSV
jgi:hypothetical protein